VHLFTNELATHENIRDEVDISIELPVVGDLANQPRSAGRAGRHVPRREFRLPWNEERTLARVESSAPPPSG
jgi:hypothetical protein